LHTPTAYQYKDGGLSSGFSKTHGKKKIRELTLINFGLINLKKKICLLIRRKAPMGGNEG